MDRLPSADRRGSFRAVRPGAVPTAPPPSLPGRALASGDGAAPSARQEAERRPCRFRRQPCEWLHLGRHDRARTTSCIRLMPIRSRSLLPLYDGFSTVLLRRLLFVISGNPPGPATLSLRAILRQWRSGVSPQNKVGGDVAAHDGHPGRIRLAPRLHLGGSGLCAGQRNPRGGRRSKSVDGAMVVNRYRRLAERHETVPDRRIVRFLPRLRALLHDVSVAATPVAIPIPAPPPRQAAAPAAPAPSVAAPRVVPPAPRAAVTLPLSPSDGAPVVPPDAPGPSAVAPSPAAAASQPAAAGTWQRTPALLSQAASVAPSPPPAAVAIPIPAPAKVPAVAAASVPASLRLGIGITTYNRESVLAQTLDRVQRHTTHLDTIVAVVDDGSTDGTLDMLRARQVLAVTGRNTGVAWNEESRPVPVAGAVALRRRDPAGGRRLPQPRRLAE